MIVFLSSTSKDLQGYRKRATEALERLGTHSDRMEVWGAVPGEPLEVCLKKVEKCDLFVGVYAYWYGSIPEGEEYSFSELEYNHAKKLGKPQFCFCIDKKKTPNWPPEYIEGEPGQSKLESFKARLQRELVVEWFTTTLDLGMKVGTSVGQYLCQTKGINIYSTIWKEASQLTAEEIMGAERGQTQYGFKPYYFAKRPAEERFRKELAAANRHVLLVGRPLAGKTRMVYEWLRREAKSVCVLIPHYQDINRESFTVPPHGIYPNAKFYCWMIYSAM